MSNKINVRPPVTDEIYARNKCSFLNHNLLTYERLYVT